MIYLIYAANGKVGAVRSTKESIIPIEYHKAKIEADSADKAVFLYVSELERRSKEQPTLLSLMQKLAERNAYLEQAITNHLAVIEQIRATVRSECNCKLKERMIET